MFNNILFKNREFRLLWLSQLTTFIGEGIFQTAMIWWVIQQTGSGTMVGLITSMSFLPAVLIGPFAGTLVDRMNPKILLNGANLSRALFMTVFGYIAVTGNLEVYMLFWLCGLVSAFGVVDSPTILICVPRVVEETDMEESMALITIVRDISRLAGPALGGLIIARWSVGHAFWGNTVCLLLSALCVVLVNIGKIERSDDSEGILFQLKAGFRYVWGEKLLFKLLTGFGMLNLFVVPIIVLLPLTISKVFMQVDSEHLETAMISMGYWEVKGSMALGISNGILALGSVITGLFFVKLFAGVKNSRLLIRALAVNVALFAIFAFNSTSYVLFNLGLFFLGGCFTSVNVALLSLFQKTVAPEMKGRFFALVEVLSFALFPLALAVSGSLADIVGVRGCYAICAGGVLIITIFLGSQKDLPALDA